MISLHIVWFVLICIVTLTLLYISFVQYKRANKTEEIANLLADRFVEIRKNLTEASDLVNQNPRLKTAFEGDDEVGDFFRLLQNVAKELESTVEDTENAENKEG